MCILAVDLGKYKSVACVFDEKSADHEFRTIPTTPQEVHDLLLDVEPERVVIEVGNSAGWVQDLCEGLSIPIEVANPSHEAWRWKNAKRKTDRNDALRLAKLSAAHQLPTVHLPRGEIRQWRAMIAYRATLVQRRTMIKNSIRAILDREGIRHPSGGRGWSREARGRLEMLASSCKPEDRWRFMLRCELTALDQIEALIHEVEDELEQIASKDERVALLRTIPGVGPRLAEMVVAMIDDPKRFRNGKQVGAYAGLAPRQFESGTMHRQGRITRAGNPLLRCLLVEVAWLMRRHNGWLRTAFERVRRGTPARSKIAAVATARRLLVICWAMLRDGTPWNPPPRPSTVAGPA